MLALGPPALGPRGEALVELYQLVRNQRRELGHVNDGSEKAPRWRRITVLHLGIVSRVLEDLGIPERGEVLAELEFVDRVFAGDVKDPGEDDALGTWVRAELERLDAWPSDGWLP